MTKNWLDHKHIIVKLYETENKTLRQVREIMEREYNFKASTRSYRQHFDSWGVKKYKRRTDLPSPPLTVRSLDDGDEDPLAQDQLYPQEGVPTLLGHNYDGAQPDPLLAMSQGMTQGMMMPSPPLYTLSSTPSVAQMLQGQQPLTFAENPIDIPRRTPQLPIPPLFYNQSPLGSAYPRSLSGGNMVPPESGGLEIRNHQQGGSIRRPYATSQYPSAAAHWYRGSQARSG